MPAISSRDMPSGPEATLSRRNSLMPSAPLECFGAGRWIIQRQIKNSTTSRFEPAIAGPVGASKCCGFSGQSRYSALCKLWPVACIERRWPLVETQEKDETKMAKTTGTPVKKAKGTKLERKEQPAIKNLLVVR